MEKILKENAIFTPNKSFSSRRRGREPITIAYEEESTPKKKILSPHFIENSSNASSPSSSPFQRRSTRGSDLIPNDSASSTPLSSTKNGKIVGKKLKKEEDSEEDYSSPDENQESHEEEEEEEWEDTKRVEKSRFKSRSLTTKVKAEEEEKTEKKLAFLKEFTPKKKGLYDKVKLSNTKKDPPKGWKEIWDGIVEMRRERNAPVDLMGSAVLADKNEDKKTFRYQTLLSLLLSSQTKDGVTGQAMANLKKHGCNVENILSE